MSFPNGGALKPSLCLQPFPRYWAANINERTSTLTNERTNRPTNTTDRNITTTTRQLLLTNACKACALPAITTTLEAHGSRQVAAVSDSPKPTLSFELHYFKHLL